MDPEERARLHRRWAVETGRIEGVYQLSDAEVKSLVEDGFSLRTTAGSQWLLDVLSDEAATLDAVLADARTGPLNLTLEHAHAWHRLLVRGAPYHALARPEGGRIAVLIPAGRVKRVPNVPTRSDRKLHVYALPSETPAALDNFFELLNEYQQRNVAPAVLAAWAHHRFVEIHPYLDGNGR